jgi:hypothetical protein
LICRLKIAGSYLRDGKRIEISEGEKEMNKPVMLVVSTLLLASGGCASPRQAALEDPELYCGARTVTVFHGPAFLAAYPETIDVCRGQEITVTVTPKVPAGAARTSPGERYRESGAWLGGEASSGGNIVIEIPNTVELGTYKYNITVDGVGTLDPTARVVR